MDDRHQHLFNRIIISLSQLFCCLAASRALEANPVRSTLRLCDALLYTVHSAELINNIQSELSIVSIYSIKYSKTVPMPQIVHTPGTSERAVVPVLFA